MAMQREKNCSRPAQGKLREGRCYEHQLRARIAPRDSARVVDLFAGLVVCAEILRYRLQRGIKLHERVLYCGVLVMAGPAVALRLGLG
jgi:hypothetical protein